MPIVLTSVLNLTVNFLLILTAGALCKKPPALYRALLGAIVGAAHSLLCFVSAGFWGHTLWRLVCIILMGLTAFGRKDRSRLPVFCILSLGMDAVTAERVVLTGICILLLWLLLSGKKDAAMVPIWLQYKNRELKLTALRDTGNTLCDPITGSQVLVIGPEAAGKLTGLTVEQVRRPLEFVGALPGLRLIPYKAVGSSGFLLGMRLPRVKIGNWQGSYVVAFAPEGLDGNMGFEALLGGSV